MAIISSFGAANGTNNMQSLLRKGYRLQRKGDVVGAELCFRRAVALDTRSAEAWHALASTQLGARRAICIRWAAAGSAPLPLPVPAAAARSRLLRSAVAGMLGATGMLGLLVAGTDLAYARRVLPNVSIAGVSAGNLPLDRLDDLVAERQAQIARRVVHVSAAGNELRIPLGTLLHDTGDQLSSAAGEYGHQAGFVDRAATRARALWGYDMQLGRPEIDIAGIERAVAAIAAAVELPVVDAQLVRRGETWRVEPEQHGRALDRAKVRSALRLLLLRNAWNTDAGELALPIEAITLAPATTSAQLLPIRDRLRELAARPLRVVAGEQSWTLDPSTLVRFDEAAGAEGVRPDAAAIDAQLDPAANALLILPRPSRLEREGERVRALVAGLPGRELDRPAATALIGKAIVAADRQVELPLREVAPPPGEIEQLGLLAELGRGELQFVTYSSSNRDANVLAGGRDINGILVAPGEEFSFNTTVGWIGEEKGYQWGEAIENGAVVPAIGGGICQVSTTVFRAAFWSGLPIVERHNHMWRLPWYEVDAPAGMDATIAIGGPDFRFRNDTNGHILIKVETDLLNKRQTVILLGTPDGRRVEMQPITNGNTGVYRSVIGTQGILADEAFVSYYTQ